MDIVISGGAQRFNRNNHLLNIALIEGTGVDQGFQY
jgi:hypothetical protein